MKEKGSLRQIQAKYEPQPQVCPDYSGKPLGVGSVFTAFGVLFLGAAFALLIFCFERIAQAFGVELFIFNTYGVGDQPTECHKHNLMQLLIYKEEEIIALKDTILVLRNQGNKTKVHFGP